MKLILLVLAVLLNTTNACAGAWPRDEGELFIAAGGNFLLSEGAELPVHYDPTLYAEYGLFPTLTLGTDLYTADKSRIASVFVFAKTQVGPADANLRKMAGLGLGYRRNADATEELMLRTSLSLGQSLSQGWLAFDGSLTYGTVDQSWRPKGDFTWGHAWTDQWTTTVQIQTGTGFSGDHYAKLSPTLIRTINERIRINFGAVQALTGDRGGALKVETWLTF